ncbi:MAG: hypothetical protein WDO71_28180 [Bacteroidota bacterium]
MKTIGLNAPVRTIFLAFIAATIIFSFYSCSSKVAFLTSSVVPAARGSVKVKKDNNNNYHIEIHLTNLAEVKRLEPPRQSYVVWMETSHQEIKNIGQINSSAGLFSQKLKASFETVSALKPAKIFITAEDDVSIQYPGTQIILSTDNF